MKRPSCGAEIEAGFLYVRGLGGSLFWSTEKNAASQYGLLLALGVTFAVCTPESRRPDTCRLDIASSGGIITPDQHGAYWPANQL